MNANIRKTAIAMAVAAVAASPAAFAQDDPNESIDINHNHIVVEDWDITIDDTRNYTTNTVVLDDTTTNTTVNDTTNTIVLDDTTTNTTVNDVTNTTNNTANTTLNAEANLTLNAEANLLLNAEANYLEDISNVESNTLTNTETNTLSNTETNTETNDIATSYTSTETRDVANSYSSSESYSTTENSWSNEVYENIERTEVVNSDIRKEGNEHQVAVSLKKDLSLNSDINFSGDPEITGAIDLDSAAIAVIDNRQTISGNSGENTMLSNDASISDEMASTASGNLGFNVAAGDNNAQDNAAALSAADASFSFGMADAEVFVNQVGAQNTTMNEGVTNAASLGGNAFGGATGNIGVNIASGNNNEQKNALAASVATSAYAQSSISSNQISSGNSVTNAGYEEERTSTIDVTLSGTVSGSLGGEGGQVVGSYSGRGNSYQQSNFYPDTYDNGNNHPNGDRIGHDDWDIEAQGAVANPYRPGVGGMAWDTDEEGDLVLELGNVDLLAALSGEVTQVQYVVVDATNTASLSGSAFSAASGNIGVNVASGTGNLQANSLALAVAQPSTGGGGGGNGE